MGIQSPSIVFAVIGVYMSEGFGICFVKAMDSVKHDIKNAILTNLDIIFDKTPGGGFNSNTSNTFNIVTMIVRSDSNIGSI